MASRSWVAVFALFAALVTSPFAGCAEAAVGKLSFDVNGVRRTAVMVEFARLKRVRRPLIIVLHGSSGDGARVRKNLGLDEMVENSGAVLVFPDAFEGRWSIDATTGAKADDAAFFRAIVARLQSQGIIDPSRVYVVGVSTGGMMAMQLACTDAQPYAGIATVIANMPGELAATCAPAKPVPILMINGTADPRVPYLGGATKDIEPVGNVASTDDSLAIFAKAAGCGAKAPDYSFPNRNPKSGSRAFLHRFEGCKVPVELVRIEGGGHTIPGRWSGQDAGAPVGSHNVDVDTARLIFDFFKKVSGR